MEQRKEELAVFLSQFGVLTPAEVSELSEQMVVSDFVKNTVIVRAGQVCNQCFFVLKGCLRQYMVVDGVDRTIAFYTEGQAVNFYTSTTRQLPCDSFLQSIEDSVVLIGDPQRDALLYEAYPGLTTIVTKMMAEDFGLMQDAFHQFMTSSPEERYRNLLEKRPDLLQRVPQHQLAGYLGITPESLSRIRKRIAKAQ